MKLQGMEKNLLCVTLPVVAAVLLFLELFFRLVIPACTKPLAFFDRDHAMLRADATRRTTGLYTMGPLAQYRARWRTNNWGWNSPVDYVSEKGEKKRVCIIGDSYVRALQVDVDKSFSSLLRRMAGDTCEVYSFGHDGAPLSQYLHMSRYVRRVFSPDVMIFLLIHNDFDESLVSLARKPYFLQLAENREGFYEVAPQETPLYQWLTWSATFRYMFKNLDLAGIYFKMAERPKGYTANVDPDRLAGHRDRLLAVTTFVLKRIRDENPGIRLIVAMDAPRPDIYSEGPIEESPVFWMNRMAADICAKLGLEFVDLTGPFQEAFKTTGDRLEFDINNHWNENGHDLAARILASNLQGL
ncbi:MAG: SGNH/GDSL hydrolase family protein [Thermodesulfobacteriota bacterium]